MSGRRLSTLEAIPVVDLYCGPPRLTRCHERVSAVQYDTFGGGVRCQRTEGGLGAGLHGLGVLSLHQPAPHLVSEHASRACSPRW